MSYLRLVRGMGKPSQQVLAASLRLTFGGIVEGVLARHRPVQLVCLVVGCCK